RRARTRRTRAATEPHAVASGPGRARRRFRPWPRLLSPICPTFPDEFFIRAVPVVFGESRNRLRRRAVPARDAGDRDSFTGRRPLRSLHLRPASARGTRRREAGAGSIAQAL